MNNINHNHREKLFSVSVHDCDVQTFRGSGKGGQNRNKRDTAVRIVHRPSGAVAESQEERHQRQNKKIAFLRMIKTEKFETWRRMETMRLLGHFPKSVAEIVDEQMADENLLVEYR